MEGARQDYYFFGVGGFLTTKKKERRGVEGIEEHTGTAGRRTRDRETRECQKGTRDTVRLALAGEKDTAR